MRFDKMPHALVREGDTPAMIKAIQWLDDAGADTRRPPNSNYQLKVSDTLSYYPGKGTIYRDGDPSPLPDRGLDALISLLQSEALIPEKS